MLEISVSKINKDYGFGKILNDVSFEVMNGDIISIVGENGCGKSTLLKIMASLENANSGIVSVRKNSTVGYLGQTTCCDEGTVRDILYRSLEEINIIEKKLKEYEEKMVNTSGDLLDEIVRKYSNLQERFISIGGYETSEKVGKIVGGFKIEKLLDLNYNNLSGGEKRIVTFAALMIKKPDILLLDEPTNHLDIDTLEWLEGYLKGYKGTIIIVSHDRYFLDKITNKTILLEDGKSILFNANYSLFLELNKNIKILQEKDYKEQQKEIKRMEDSAKRLREFGNIAKNEMFYKRAKSIEKRIDKLDKIDRPKGDNVIPLKFKQTIRSGEMVLTIKDLCIEYPNKVIFDNANMNIRYGEHICLIGRNGSGKSTLINSILSINNNIKIGNNVKIGYIPQDIIFDKDSTVYEYARRYFIGEDSILRSALFKFKFIGNDIYKKISSLSGGEKVRLKLFCLMQEDVNFLILDEPTNHIDVATRKVLEESLNEYVGTIFFVSHDRYFINKLAMKIISIENNKLVEYPGNYDDYKNFVRNKKKF